MTMHVSYIQVRLYLMWKTPFGMLTDDRKLSELHMYMELKGGCDEDKKHFSVH